MPKFTAGRSAIDRMAMDAMSIYRLVRLPAARVWVVGSAPERAAAARSGAEPTTPAPAPPAAVTRARRLGPATSPAAGSRTTSSPAAAAHGAWKGEPA